MGDGGNRSKSWESSLGYTVRRERRRKGERRKRKEGKGGGKRREGREKEERKKERKEEEGKRERQRGKNRMGDENTYKVVFYYKVVHESKT